MGGFFMVQTVNDLKEKIVKAKNVDIVSFCQSVGYDLVQEKGRGNQYRGVDHGSLVVFQETNSFRWFKEEVSGDSIDFVEMFLEKTKSEAVDLLIETAESTDFKERKPIERKPDEPFRYVYKHDRSTEKVEKYLIEERKIDTSIVKTLIKKGLIRQSTYNGESDCLFVWGKSGKRVGVSIQGVERNEEKYGYRGTKKMVGRNSEKFYGFNVSLGKPKDMFFFESPVDLLSYWSLNPRLTDCRLVAMTGLNKNTVMNMLRHTMRTRSVVYDVNLAVDNDAAGQKFVDQFKDFGYEFENGGALNFNTIIPDNNAILQKNYDIYQQVAQEHQVPWQLLAAWHKVESNFDPEMRIANNMKVDTYFSEISDVKRKERVFDLAKSVEQLATDLVKVKEDGKYKLENLITIEKNTDADGFIEKVRNVYKDYYRGEFVVKDVVHKDWNDVQKEQYQSKTVVQESARGTLYKNDIKQVLEVTKVEKNPESPQKEYQAIMKDREKVIGHFEADSKEEMDKLIKIYGFEAMDKEDVRKYEPRCAEKAHDTEQALSR
nr:toprim domain-containing protein [Listeria ivanovii]